MTAWTPALLHTVLRTGSERLLFEPAMREAFLAGSAGGTLVALDGTEFSVRPRISPERTCLTRKRSNGKVESYHSMLRATK